MEEELLVLSGHRRGWSPKSTTGCLEGCWSRKKETPRSNHGQQGREWEGSWASMGSLRSSQEEEGPARSDAARRGRRTETEM